MAFITLGELIIYLVIIIVNIILISLLYSSHKRKEGKIISLNYF